MKNQILEHIQKISILEEYAALSTCWQYLIEASDSENKSRASRMIKKYGQFLRRSGDKQISIDTLEKFLDTEGFDTSVIEQYRGQQLTKQTLNDIFFKLAVQIDKKETTANFDIHTAKDPQTVKKIFNRFLNKIDKTANKSTLLYFLDKVNVPQKTLIAVSKQIDDIVTTVANKKNLPIPTNFAEINQTIEQAGIFQSNSPHLKQIFSTVVDNLELKQFDSDREWKAPYGYDEDTPVDNSIVPAVEDAIAGTGKSLFNVVNQIIDSGKLNNNQLRNILGAIKRQIGKKQ